ncbi:hypothetical protein Slin14017_G041220 [Septoria linicola]|nr:hypothetical protein Slin14017_G041220 [Septoria linicola]
MAHPNWTLTTSFRYQPKTTGFKHAHPLALTEACKQVRQETITLFYNINTLMIQMNFGNACSRRIKKLRRFIGGASFQATRPLIIRTHNFHNSVKLALAIAQRTEEARLRIGIVEARTIRGRNRSAGHSTGDDLECLEYIRLCQVGLSMLLRSPTGWLDGNWPCQADAESGIVEGLNKQELEALDQVAVAMETSEIVDRQVRSALAPGQLFINCLRSHRHYGV